MNRILIMLGKIIYYYILIRLLALIPLKRNVVVFSSQTRPQLEENSHVLYNYLKRYHHELKLYKLLSVSNSSDDVLNVRKNPADVLRLLRAKYIVVTHGTSDLGLWRGLALQRKRTVINLWHGEGLKKTGLASLEHKFLRTSKQYKKAAQQIISETRSYSWLIAGSELARHAHCASTNVTADRVLVTGLPRNDFFWDMTLIDSNWLEQVNKLIDGYRHVILYAPTYRNENHIQAYMHTLPEFSAQKLECFLEEKDAILIYRNHRGIKHTGTTKRIYEDIKKIYERCSRIKFAHPDQYPYAQPFLKVADVLITDYASLFSDFLLMDNPMISICHDLDEYERTTGMLFDNDHVFPGTKVRTFPQLLEEIHSALEFPEQYKDLRQDRRCWFHTYCDGQACQRIAKLFFE